MRKARESALKGEYFRNILSMHISKVSYADNLSILDHRSSVTRVIHLSHVTFTE